MEEKKCSRCKIGDRENSSKEGKVEEEDRYCKVRRKVK